MSPAEVLTAARRGAMRWPSSTGFVITWVVFMTLLISGVHPW